MAFEFIMPQLGLTMTEGTVSKWFKQVGETVAVGEVLAEVSTDKISNQIEAPAAGTVLAILVPEGGSAPVKTPLALIGEPGEMIDAPAAPSTGAVPPAAAPAAAAETAGVPRETNAGWVKASPLARKIARERGLDLAVVTGTGPDGRVVERDVLGAAAPATVRATPLAAKVAAENGVALAAIGQDGRIYKQDVLDALTKPAAAETAAGTPLTGMRRVIAERMTQSWQTAPHVHHTVEVDMSAAVQLKEKLARKGIKLSFTELIVKVVAKALQEYPAVNSWLVDGRVVVNEEINVGVAVAVENGLIVPVVRNADRKSLSRLRTEIADLGGKARAGKLLPDEYTGGTFTVSNLGMYGVDHFTPIINPPESGILGVCRVVERPVAVAGAIVVRPLMNLILGYDHRGVDGAVAGKFTSRVRELLEEPGLLI